MLLEEIQAWKSLEEKICMLDIYLLLFCWNTIMSTGKAVTQE